MKRLFNILICASMVALLSCVNDRKTTSNSSNNPSDEKGVLTLNVATRAEGDAVQRDYTLDIYKNEGERSFVVRKYDSSNAEMHKPEYIWLLEGNYTAKVVSGNAVGATFDKEEQYFRGEVNFDIVGGETKSVDLIADMQNIPVEVVFDQTVIDGFHEGYYVVVSADSRTQLQYTESCEGYFIMPEGVTSLTWNFVGTYEYKSGELVDVNSTGTIDNVDLKKGYKLLFKYSKDAPGMLGNIEVLVDESVEERDDHLSFSPDPEVKGDGFDESERHNYVGGERKYIVTSIGNMNVLTISVDGRTYDLATESVAGISVVGFGTTQMTISLSDDFFNILCGGEQNISITISDVEGGSTTKKLPYNLQGANAYNTTNTNLWSGVSTLSATVFGEHQSVQIACRKSGAGDWKAVNAVLSGENTYSAVISDIAADGDYEYKLILDGVNIGASCSFATEDGAQIPNAGLEDWTTSGKVVIPYYTLVNPYWCTGNYGTASLSRNITQSSPDVRPGSTGTKSAYMDSEYIVVKFAAGNLYIGSWGGMNGTNALVNFGQPFTFNAKPKAIRFWAKWNCGTIDKAEGGVGKSGDPDLCKIFCCMTTDTHLVDSSDAKGTTFSPSDANIKSGDSRYNIVLYSAYFETTQSQTEWKQMEIPFTFYGSDPNQVPTHLILTFTCSGYGDFFDGSTESWMYVDDIELVY